MGYCYFKDNNHKSFNSLDITKDPAHRHTNSISPIIIPHQPDSFHIINTDRIPQSNSYKHKLQKYFPTVTSSNTSNKQLQLNVDTSNGIDSGRTDFNELNVHSPTQPNNFKPQSPFNNSPFMEYSYIFDGNYPLTASPSCKKHKSPRKSN